MYWAYVLGLVRGESVLNFDRHSRPVDQSSAYAANGASLALHPWAPGITEIGSASN